MKIQMKKLTKEQQKVIKKQPGYISYPKGKFAISYTRQGGIRLYAWINKTWMDASLEDIADPCIVSLMNPEQELL